jgi:cell division protein FtsN
MAGQITTRPDFSAQVPEPPKPIPVGPAILCLEVTEATVFVRPGGSLPLSVERACEMAAEAVRTHEGSVLNIVPEMVIAEFAHSAHAVRTALEIQRRISGENENAPRYAGLELRIGIFAAADAESRPLDGAFVNLSTKVSRRAGPGQILISRGVYQAVCDDSDLQCQWATSLKSETETQPIDVFEVSYSEAPACVPARYEVLSRVGTGGMGIVYKVRDLDAREVIALKILKPEAASNEAMQENLRREVFLARKVTHKNVCRIHEFNRSKGTAYISMEFIEGESLLRRLRRVCTIAPAEAVELVRQICAGLREAHVQGIVHRDLKPANIMIDGTGAVKIMDFGIARLAQENVQHTGTIAGTPSYMAPEQVQLQPVGPRTDIYSIGLLLYEMVVGKQAFEGENSIVIALKQLNELPKRPREIAPEIPARLEDVILKCLEKDPAKRFQTIDEFDAALAISIAPVKTPSSLADAMETDLRRAGHNIHALVHRGVEKARPAVPVVVRLAQNAAREARRLELNARYGARDAFAFCGAYYRRWLGFSLKAKAVTASVAIGFLLVGVVAIARGSKQSYASTAVPAAAVASLAPGDSANEAVAPSGAPEIASDGEAVKSQPVDLSVKLGVAPEATGASDDATSTTPDAKPEESLDAKESVVKPPADSATSTAAASHVRAARLSAHSAKSGAVAHPVLASMNTSLPIEDPTQKRALTDAAKLEPAPAPVTAPASQPPADAVAKSQLAEPYLEVTSYKDQLLADETVANISKLGMHAFSVQKSHLWMETFHVEVGPFSNSTDMLEAQKELSAKGFKAHPSK